MSLILILILFTELIHWYHTMQVINYYVRCQALVCPHAYHRIEKSFTEKLQILCPYNPNPNPHIVCQPKRLLPPPLLHSPRRLEVSLNEIFWIFALACVESGAERAQPRAPPFAKMKAWAWWLSPSDDWPCLLISERALLPPGILFRPESNNRNFYGSATCLYCIPLCSIAWAAACDGPGGKLW